MLQGAIIGAIVGFVLAITLAWMRSKRAARFLEAIDNGDTNRARSMLDRWSGPVEKISLNKLLDQAARMAALTLLGDAAALEREVSRHRGHTSAVAQVDAVGLLGLCLISHDPAAAAAQLDELAQLIDQGVTSDESLASRMTGRAPGLVRGKVILKARLARALLGQPLTPEEARSVDRLAAGESKLVKLITLQALGRALEADGRSDGAEAAIGYVRQHTRAFEILGSSPDSRPPARL